MSYPTITVYEKDLGPDNKRENAADIVQRKIRTDHEGNDYARYKNEFYKVHGRIKNRYHRDYGNENLVIFLDDEYERPERKKRVFSSHSEVAHAWAHHMHDSNNFAENGQSGDGRVYYNGNSIYSYGSHFEMARILPDVPGQDVPVVLVNEHTYSPSTSGHQSHVRSAIPNDWIKVYVKPENKARYYNRSYTLFDYGTNEENKQVYRSVIQQICDEIEECRDKATRKQKIYTLRGSINRVKSLQAKAKQFIDIFQCKSVLLAEQERIINKPVFDTKEEFWKVARRVIGRKQRELEKERDRLLMKVRAKGLHDNPEELRTSQLQTLWDNYKKKVKVIEAVEKFENFKENLHQWRAGEGRITYWDVPSLPWNITKSEAERLVGKELPDIAPVYLRKHPNMEDAIQTTKGARIELKDLKLAWKLFQRYGEEAIEKSNGPKDFVHINGQVNLGNFTSIPSVNSEGTFRFGCHDVIPSERNYILKQFGLI